LFKQIDKLLSNSKMNITFLHTKNWRWHFDNLDVNG